MHVVPCGEIKRLSDGEMMNLYSRQSVGVSQTRARGGIIFAFRLRDEIV